MRHTAIAVRAMPAAHQGKHHNSPKSVRATEAETVVVPCHASSHWVTSHLDATPARNASPRNGDSRKETGGGSTRRRGPRSRPSRDARASHPPLASTGTHRRRHREGELEVSRSGAVAIHAGAQDFPRAPGRHCSGPSYGIETPCRRPPWVKNPLPGPAARASIATRGLGPARRGALHQIGVVTRRVMLPCRATLSSLRTSRPGARRRPRSGG